MLLDQAQLHCVERNFKVLFHSFDAPTNGGILVCLSHSFTATSVPLDGIASRLAADRKGLILAAARSHPELGQARY
jgi:hypothetical protein